VASQPERYFGEPQPAITPGPSFEDGVLVAALWDVQAELALQQVSAQQVSVQAELALQQVSVQQASVQAELALQQVSVQQASRVESRSPVWQGLAPASPQAAYEQLAVYLARYAPGLVSYFRIAPLQQAALQALLQRPDEEHTALPQGRLWQLRRCVAVPRRW
jgi:hypothetical protein